MTTKAATCDEINTKNDLNKCLDKVNKDVTLPVPLFCEARTSDVEATDNNVNNKNDQANTNFNSGVMVQDEIKQTKQPYANMSL